MRGMIYTNDIDLANGTIAMGVVDNQQLEELLMASPGSYRLDPLAGADIEGLLLDDGAGLVAIVEEQVEADGADLLELRLEQERFFVQAIYTQRKEPVEVATTWR